MFFVALLYSQFPIKERIQLDASKSIVPLGWAPLRQWGHGSSGAAGFKFAFIEKDIPEKKHPFDVIGFTDTSVKKFLDFFSFITNDNHSIKEFEGREDGARYFRTDTEVSSFLKAETVSETGHEMPLIEATFAIRYWPKPPLGSIAMSEAWKIFLAKEEKYRDMVSVHHAQFGGPLNGIYQIFNKETLQLFLLITVLEGLLDPRSACSGTITCTLGCTPDYKHNLLSTEKYWRSELGKKLHFPDNTGYIELVISLQKQVRNSFAHGGQLLPDAARVIGPLAQGSHTRFLQLPCVVSGINTDQLARINALMILRDIVWFVLMRHFFPDAMTAPWPNLDLLKETRIGHFV